MRIRQKQLDNAIISGNKLAANSVLTGHLANSIISGNLIDAGSRLVEVKSNGSLIGNRKSINFIGCTVTDDPANNDIDVTPAGGSIPVIKHLSLYPQIPVAPAAGTISPLQHSSNYMRLFPFSVPAQLVVNQVLIRGGSAAANNCLIAALYNDSGARVWVSNPISSIVNSVAGGYANSVHSGQPALPVTLQPGTYYFGTTNNGNTFVTSQAWATITTQVQTQTQTMPARLNGRYYPEIGGYPITSGQCPPNFNISGIHPLTSGFIAFVNLCN